MSGLNYSDFLNIYPTKALHLLRELTFSLTPFYKQNVKISEINQFVTIQLFTNLYSTSECILILIKECGIWEADILLRVLIEGSIKYIFLMSGELKSDSDVIKEYYFSIPEMQKISEHKKAKEALELFRLYAEQKHPFEVSLLSEEDFKILDQRYPKKVRREMEQRWGFGNLLKLLTDKNKKYESLVGLYYSYCLSSHFVHFDGMCVKMRHDSMMQIVGREDYSLDIAHAARIISNVVSLGLIRVSEYISKYGLEADKFSEKIEEATLFLSELENINQDLIRGKF